MMKDEVANLKRIIDELMRASIPTNVQLVSDATDIPLDDAAPFDGQCWDVPFSRHDLE